MLKLRWLLLALAAVGLAGPAQAVLLPVNVTVLPEGDAWRWTYSVVIPTDQYVTAGDYFTVYDFQGLTDAAILMPDGWSVTLQNVGKTPGLVTPTDNPSIVNLSFTYNGDPIFGSVGAGNFSASSNMNDSADGFFTSRTHRDSDSQTEDSITYTDVPVPSNGGGPPVETPEPATIALVGLGLPVLGLARLVRRNKKN